jgi:hypothetical protein
MNRRSALIVMVAAIPGVIYAQDRGETATITEGPGSDITANLVTPHPGPMPLVFEADCFSTITLKSEDGDVVIRWRDVIEALR